MSLSAINEYQRKLCDQQQLITQLRHRFTTLQQDHARQIQSNNQTQKALQQKDTNIKHLTRDKESKQKFIEQLKNKIKKQQEDFKLLYDNCHCLESLSVKETKLISDGHRLELQIQDMKLSAEKQEVKTLEKLLSDKRQVIRKILGENRQLKESVLKLTQQYHLEIIELKSKPATVISVPSESVSNKIEYTKTTSDYLLELKNAQINQLKEKYAKQFQSNKLLIARQKQLQRELVLARRDYEPLEFEQAYIQNSRLVLENKQLKSKLQEYNIEGIQELKKKTKKYLDEGDNLEILEKIKLSLEEKLVQNSVRDQEQFVTKEINDLRANEKQLLEKIEKCFRTLSKFNEAFKKINPYFEVYKYDLINIDSVAEQILEEKQIAEADDLATRKYNVEMKERDLAKRQSNLLREKNEVLKKINEFQNQKKDKISMEEEQPQRVLNQNSKYYEALEKQQSQKVNELVSTINDYKRREAIWQGQKRYLLEEKQLLKLSKPQELILSPINYIQLQSINLPNVVYQKIDKNIPSTINDIQSRVAECNQSMSSLLQDHRMYLNTISANNLYIQNLSKQLHETKAKLARAEKSLTEKDVQLQKLGSQIKKLQEKEEKQPDEPRPSHLIDQMHSFPDNSDINTENIKQLSLVLSHNETITQRLLEQLQVVKAQYKKLQEISMGSQVLNREIVFENNDLKLKLTEAVVEIQSANDRQNTTQEEITLLRSENQRLSKECDQKERENNLGKEIVSKQLEKLKSTVNANIATSLSGVESELDPNSTSLISIVESLKQLVNQKNSEILYLQDQLHSKGKSIEQQHFDTDLSKLLEKAINVITGLRQNQ